jgi:peptidoglycan/LPS O-acetylase OafA/YrhL
MGLLRLALAFCVFYGHSASTGAPILRGEIAVEAFYVISGFYMQLVLGTIYTPARLGTKWIQRFYANRYLRLFPTYIITAGATIAFAGAYSLLHPGVEAAPLAAMAAVSELKQSIPNIALKAYLLFTNIFMLFQDATMFLGVRDGTARLVADFSHSQIQLWQALALPQAWSIGVELSFYLLAPFLLRLSSRLLAIILIISLTSKIAFLAIVTGHTAPYTGIGNILPNAASLWGYRFLPFELTYFLAGALAYRYFESKLFKPRISTRITKIIAYTAIFTAITLASFVVNKTVLCWLYPFIFAVAAPPLFSLFRASQQDRLIGNLSYPFYMAHELCLRATNPLQTLNIPGLHTITALIFTLFLSVVLTKGERLIEKARIKLKTSPT